MYATLLLVALALGQAQPQKPVTDAEKKEFLKLLVSLPTRGEFFAEEAIPKAAPYTRVLLALTEKDLEKCDIYPFLALSAGLMGQKDARQYATANFGKIAHPQIKLGWAIRLFRHGKPPPEVVPFLRKALDSEKEVNFGLGPGFQDFKDDVIRAYEAGKLMKVELTRQHSIGAFPKFGGGFDYTNSTYVFAPGPVVYAVRPHREQQRGELITYDLSSGNASRRAIQQPKGFKPKFDFWNYFDNPALSINSRGDLLCWWTIEGNGDHGFALLKKGADSAVVNRVCSYLSYVSHVVPRPDGAWYLIQSETMGFFNVFHIDEELKLSPIGTIRQRQSSMLLDARFISNDMVHVFSMREENGQSALRCADFDVQQKRWLHNRETLRLEQWVSPSEGTVLQFKDGSLHYLWGLNDRRDDRDPKGKKRERLDGLYYQAEADATVLKVGGGNDHRAIAVGDRIVICYTEESSPNQVFFRVIRNGALGPVTEVTIAKDRKHNLSAEYMVLYAESDRTWFANTLEPNTLHELKLVDTTKP